MRRLVCLRPMEEADADSIVLWRNKEWVRRNFLYQEPFTREGQLNWVRNDIHLFYADRNSFFAIICREPVRAAVS